MGRARRWGVLAALLAALFGGGLVLAGAASAHATVVASNPQDGSRLKAVPKTVTITFDEPVGLGGVGYLSVVNQNGTNVDAGNAYHPHGTGSIVAVDLKSGLGDGTYIESWRVISADSHPVAGTVRFVVGNGALSTISVSTSATDEVTSVVFDAVRWLGFAGFALLASAWLVLTVWPDGRDDRRARGIIWTGWTGTALATVLGVLVQGPYSAGTGISSAFRATLLDTTLHNDYGQYLSARLVVLGVLAPLLGQILQPDRRPSVFGDREVLPLLAALAFTFSATGHPETTSPAWLSVPIDMLHILSMGAWIGGLVMLLVAILPRREPDELRAVLPVFSKVAFGSVAVLGLSGLYEAWRGVGEWDALFTTEYGWLVVVKVVLFGGLLALGNVSRVAIQRRLSQTADDPELVRRGVVIEIVVAIIVLAVTAVLVAQPRGKEAVATREDKPRTGTAQLGGGRTLSLTVDPGRHGNVNATISLSPGAQPKAVTATAALPSKHLGPITLKLATNGTDAYSANNVVLPSGGNWVFTFVVSTGQFDATTTDLTLHIY